MTRGDSSVNMTPPPCVEAGWQLAEAGSDWLAAVPASTQEYSEGWNYLHRGLELFTCHQATYKGPYNNNTLTAKMGFLSQVYGMAWAAQFCSPPLPFLQKNHPESNHDPGIHLLAPLSSYWVSGWRVGIVRHSNDYLQFWWLHRGVSGSQAPQLSYSQPNWQNESNSPWKLQLKQVTTFMS